MLAKNTGEENLAEMETSICSRTVKSCLFDD